MLKDMNLENFSVLNCTKNISKTTDIKHIIISVNMIDKNNPKSEEPVKMMCSFTINKDSYVKPMKVAFLDYKNFATLERCGTETVIEDIKFIENIFDKCENKKLYL